MIHEILKLTKSSKADMKESSDRTERVPARGDWYPARIDETDPDTGIVFIWFPSKWIIYIF